MNLSEMCALLNVYVDDIVSPIIAVSLFNAGQNKMAAEIKATFPQLIATDSGSSLAFDERFHEVPVLYAATMIKAQDSSIREKTSFLEQFQDGLDSFTENYDLPARYKNDINVQQFIAVQDQTEFKITKDTYTPEYTRLKVYVNDAQVNYNSVSALIREDQAQAYPLDISSDPYSFKLQIATKADDCVTAIWFADYAIQEPAYPWTVSW